MSLTTDVYLIHEQGREIGIITRDVIELMELPADENGSVVIKEGTKLSVSGEEFEVVSFKLEFRTTQALRIAGYDTMLYLIVK